MSEKEGVLDRRMLMNMDNEDILLLIYLRLGKELGNKAMEIMYNEFIHAKTHWARVTA